MDDTNLEEDLKPNTVENWDQSGCTAVTVLLTLLFIICANVGDSRAVLSTDRYGATTSYDRALPLSSDHKPILAE